MFVLTHKHLSNYVLSFFLFRQERKQLPVAGLLKTEEKNFLTRILENEKKTFQCLLHVYSFLRWLHKIVQKSIHEFIIPCNKTTFFNLHAG